MTFLWAFCLLTISFGKVSFQKIKDNEFICERFVCLNRAERSADYSLLGHSD